MRETEFQPAVQRASASAATWRARRRSGLESMAATRSSAGSTRTRPSDDNAQTASPVTARVVTAPAGMRAITRLVFGSMRTSCSSNGSASHTPLGPTAMVWSKPSGPPALMVAVTRFRFRLTVRTWPPAVATQAAEVSAAMATGLAFRAMSATTRLRRTSTRSSRPPEVEAPVPDSPQQATQTVSPAALTEMEPLSGPPSGIFDATLSAAGSMPHRAPGTANGTQTAPAPTATPAGPAPPATTGILAATLLVAGSMRRIWSLPATQRAPAPAAMLEERPSVPIVATTGEGRTGASDPGEAVVAGGAVDAVAARGSSGTAPATATP